MVFFLFQPEYLRMIPLFNFLFYTMENIASLRVLEKNKQEFYHGHFNKTMCQSSVNSQTTTQKVGKL